MESYKNMKVRKRVNVKLLRNLIFFILLIIFTFWYIFKDQDINAIYNVVHESNKLYVIFGFLLMLGSYLMESVNIRSILISLGEKKFSIFRALKYTAVGAFFSALTPGSTGGQPAEVYYMTKDDIKATNGTLAMLMELCAFQISSIALSIICGILNPSLLSGSVIWFYILGIVVNGCALTGMMLAMFSNKLTKKFIIFIVKMMKKMNVKGYEKKKIKLEEGLNQYIESAKYIKNNKKVFVKSCLRVFIQVCLFHSIPYFIYRSFGLNELSYFSLFSMQAVLYTTVAAIPVPGSIGVSETLFMKLYSVAFPKILLSGAMLLFRFVSFYIYIVLFSGVVIYNAIRTKDTVSEIDNDIKEIEKDYDANIELVYS